MYFRGKSKLLQLVYSQSIQFSFSSPILTCEESGTRIFIEEKDLEVSFDSGKNWIDYIQLRGLVKLHTLKELRGKND